MSVIRITKEFHFEMAHALYGYDGPCKNIHGHSYQLDVTVIGKIDPMQTPTPEGMLIDFTRLKELVTHSIIDEVDHALMLKEDSPFKALAEQSLLNKKLILVAFQPTCENMIVYFAGKLKNLLPAGVSLHKLTLRETHTSYAEWFACDNDSH